MKIEVNENQMQLIVDSLYYANCRLGQPKMGGGKYEPQAQWLIQVFNHQKKEEEKRKE